MAKKTYRVEFIVSVDVRFDTRTMPDGLTPDDDWRAYMYAHICRPQDMAEFLAFNRLANGVDRISRLDGLDDRKDEECEFSAPEWDKWDVKEIK